MAFALLGIGLASLAPFVVMQLRQIRALENRLQGQVQRYDATTGTFATMQQVPYGSASGLSGTGPMGQTYYLVPWGKTWARKLFGPAQIVISSQLGGTASSPANPSEPASLQVQPGQTAQYSVSITGATYDGQSATATVSLGPP